MAYVASLAFFVTLGGISIGHYLNDMVPPSKVTDKNAWKVEGARALPPTDSTLERPQSSDWSGGDVKAMH